MAIHPTAKAEKIYHLFFADFRNKQEKLRLIHLAQNWGGEKKLLKARLSVLSTNVHLDNNATNKTQWDLKHTDRHRGREGIQRGSYELKCEKSQ